MKDFVHNLKQKPEHVRKRIVLGTTSAITGLVVIAWIATMGATGAFSLSTGNGTVADAGTAQPQAAPSSQSNFSQLAGAVGAAMGATTSPAAIVVVDGTSTSTLDPKPAPSTNSATVLSF